jgi:hypothetical protein
MSESPVLTTVSKLQPGVVTTPLAVSESALAIASGLPIVMVFGLLFATASDLRPSIMTSCWVFGSTISFESSVASGSEGLPSSPNLIAAFCYRFRPSQQQAVFLERTRNRGLVGCLPGPDLSQQQGGALCVHLSRLTRASGCAGASSCTACSPGAYTSSTGRTPPVVP